MSSVTFVAKEHFRKSTEKKNKELHNVFFPMIHTAKFNKFEANVYNIIYILHNYTRKL